MKTRNAIYLDHQATTPVDSRVLAEMIPYFGESFGNPHSSNHSIGWESSRAVEDSAGRIARLIGADTEEIVFTSGATEANNLGLLGLGRRASGGKRTRILVSSIEHRCVLAIGNVLRDQYGYKVERIPVDASGLVEMNALETMLDEDVLAVSIMAVNNEIGTIQDIRSISRSAWRVGALFHCDAAQAPCAIELGEMGKSVDLMSFSGHKMYGPQGIGILFIRHDLHERIEPLVYGGGQQRDLRSGTVPVPLCVGMGAAATLLVSGEAEKERNEMRDRRNRFVSKLVRMSWPITVNGPEGERRHPGNANLCFSGFDAHEILNTLQPHLAASTGSACTSGLPEPSHVLRAIGLSGEDAEASIRFSLGRGTTEAETEEAVQIIDEALSRLERRKRL